MRINFWAGPGAGKSTVAEGVSYHLKKKGHNVDLVREWIKDWAYQKRVPQSFEQAYVTISQLHSEDFLLNHGVEHVITDSPVMMSVAYCVRSNFVCWKELLRIAKQFEEKYPSINVFLSREGIEYRQNGRYETYEEALAMDRLMMDFMSNEAGVGFDVIPSVELDKIVGYVEDRLKVVPLVR